MTRAERRIMLVLGDGRWHAEPELRSRFWFLQRLYLRGLIDGAMRTSGETLGDRLWCSVPGTLPLRPPEQRP